MANDMNNLEDYKLVAERVDEARVALSIQEGWCFKSFTKEKGVNWALHYGQVFHKGRLIAQDVAFSYFYSNTSSEENAGRVNDGLIAKGETTALGRALVLCGYSPKRESVYEKAMREQGLVDKDCVLIHHPNGGSGSYELVSSRRKRFRAEHTPVKGWGLIVDVDDFVPEKRVTFTATVVHPEDYDVASASRVCTVWNCGEQKFFERYATESVGRALAAAGFKAEGSEIATAEEMDTSVGGSTVSGAQSVTVGTNSELVILGNHSHLV